MEAVALVDREFGPALRAGVPLLAQRLRLGAARFAFFCRRQPSTLQAANSTSFPRTSRELRTDPQTRVAPDLGAVLDERWIRSLHVEALRRGDLHGGHEPHVLFQASTIGALIDGSYEGEITLGELAGQGDLGLGTLNALDGELIVLDGRFYRANVEGTIHEVGPEEKAAFAVVTDFEPTISLELDKSLSQEELLWLLDGRLPAGTPSCALRLDGAFESIRARSVPRQQPPYRPLAEVIAEQHVFEFEHVEGTMVGFRFPDYAEGIEVGGYHLHFITADRARGGHVLDLRTAAVKAQLDPSSDLHVELPQEIDLDSAEVAGDTRAAIDAVEHQG